VQLAVARPRPFPPAIILPAERLRLAPVNSNVLLALIVLAVSNIVVLAVVIAPVLDYLPFLDLAQPVIIVMLIVLVLRKMLAAAIILTVQLAVAQPRPFPPAIILLAERLRLAPVNPNVPLDIIVQPVFSMIAPAVVIVLLPD